MRSIKSLSLAARWITMGLWAAGGVSGAADIVSSADTYIRNSVPTTNFGGDTSMVANLSGANVRMAVFSFDISSVPPGTITGAKLRLQDVAGNATQSYQIWGLLDTDETFVESSLTWNTAGFVSGTTVDLTKTYGGAALGTFSNVQNSVNTVFDVTGGNFLNFLNASGDNDVTFVIVDTNSTAPGSGWATKEHATALKPTLTLVSSPSSTPSVGEISDDRAGGPVLVNSLVHYTVTFSKDMDAATVDASDFGNAADATFTIGTVTETLPGVFSVPVTPTGIGSLRLQVNQDAVLSDVTGNHLVTTAAILDDTLITVDLADETNPTLGGGDFSDNQGGGPVVSGTVVTFTITFSEDMDDSTVDAADFGNAGSAAFTIGTITEVSPGVFTVGVTPTSTGTLQLKVLATAELRDAAGNLLDTTAAIASDTIITVLAGFDPSGVTRLRVFLLAGQSNADGRAVTSGLPTSPVNLQLPQADVDFFYKVQGGAATLTTLRPGRSESGNFGPEITLGRYLADNVADGFTTRAAVIKYANGGTNLHTQWKGGGNGTTAGDGSEYVVFQQTVAAGLVALAAAYPNAVIEIEGMLWVQGESDNSTANAAAYATNLTNFIADVRATYGVDLLFIVSRLSSKQTAVGATLATLRAAQDAVAAADPLTGLINTDAFGIKTDNLHFDALGGQQIGSSAGKQLLNFYPFLSPPVIVWQANGQFTFTVKDAFSGFLYTLKASSTLKTGDWQTADSMTATASEVVFTMTPAPEETRRFYRVERTLAP